MRGFLNRRIPAQARLPDAGGASGTSGRGRREGDAGVLGSPRFFCRHRAGMLLFNQGLLDFVRAEGCNKFYYFILY